jgi:tetratricopeptide (TPR) repeat protein
MLCLLPMGAAPGRNERCPCGSGRKYKLCCGAARSSPNGAAERVLRLAQGHLEAGRYGEAIGPLLEASRLVPNNAPVLHQLGIAHLALRRVPEAIAWLRRAIAAKSTDALAHFNLGLALAQAGDDEGALASHRRAVAIDPKLSEAHGRVADLLQRRGKLEEAAAAYDRAYAAAPDTSYGVLCKAKGCASRDRADEAEARLKEVIEREAASREPRLRAEAHLVLGHLFVEAGRFDEASASFERSMELAPWQTTAFHGLVSCRRQTEADRPVVARILARLGAGELGERQRMLLHFAAGKALDDLKEYAGAITQFNAANAIRRRIAPFDRRDFERLVDRIIARFTPELFARHAAMGTVDETPVLVLGMPRSGTTLIERVASSHPKVAGGGELPFWNKNAPSLVDAEIDELVAAGSGLREDYLRVLRRISSDALRVTDKMPFNFLWVGLVHAVLPKARIVHCRRNPVDTCLSIYTTHFAQDWGFASDRGDLAAYYRQYVRLMNHWREVLPRDRLLDVDYEDATAAPEPTARRLVAFCGLDWDPACLEPERNPDAVRTASKWQARQPIYRTSVERWRNYEPWLGELRDLATLVG